MKTNLNFHHVRKFLESWGMHFDTPDGESTTIPYPQVYERMRRDVINIPQVKVIGEEKLVKKFISRITDTTDGETYLTPNNWQEVEEAWNTVLAENKD